MRGIVFQRTIFFALAAHVRHFHRVAVLRRIKIWLRRNSCLTLRPGPQAYLRAIDYVSCRASRCIRGVAGDFAHLHAPRMEVRLVHRHAHHRSAVGECSTLRRRASSENIGDLCAADHVRIVRRGKRAEHSTSRTSRAPRTARATRCASSVVGCAVINSQENCV